MLIECQQEAAYNFDDHYVLHIAPLVSLPTPALVAGISSSSLAVLPIDYTHFKRCSATKSSLLEINNLHSSRLTAVLPVSTYTVATTGSDGVKLWDVRVKPTPLSSDSQDLSRPQCWLKPDLNAALLSLDVRDYRVVGGTELTGTDAGVIFWDWRFPDKQAMAYIDSHNDDVTCVKFHDKDPSAALSGSVDGLVNIYNTTIVNEDDAIHQTINHGASIHQAGFIGMDRVYALSHMETFSIYQVSDATTEELVEPKPLEFGDVRDMWDCEYVVNVYDHSIAVGSNSKKSQLKLLPFNNEQVDVKDGLEFVGAHGEEVVRTLWASSEHGVVYTGGEDGNLKLWKANNDYIKPYEGETNKINSYNDEMDIDMDAISNHLAKDSVQVATDHKNFNKGAKGSKNKPAKKATKRSSKKTSAKAAAEPSSSGKEVKSINERYQPY